MARITSPLFNNASGRVGNTVFKNVRTQVGTRAVDIAAYQPVVFNPQSQAQMRQRVLFGTAARLASGLRKSIGMQNLYTLRVGNKSQFNWFVQNFLAPSVSSTIQIVEGPDFPLGGIANTGELASGQSLAQAVVRYTQGALSFTQMNNDGIGVTYNGTIGEIEFDAMVWSTNLTGNDTAEDKLIFWAVDLFTGDTFTVDTGKIRNDGTTGGLVTIDNITVLGTSNNFRVMGFSFFREDENGVMWSQVSYPAFSLNGSSIEALPQIVEGAYNVGANRAITPPIWGLN